MYTKENLKEFKSNDLLPLTCIVCQQDFYKTKREVLRIVGGQRLGLFCSQKCRGISFSEKHSKIVNCTNCNKEIIKNLSDFKKIKNPFCSQSCAGTFNGKAFPKRKPELKSIIKRLSTQTCTICTKFSRTKTRICQSCKTEIQLKAYGEKIIEDFKSTYARHKYQKIRNHAHQIFKFYSIEKKCKICEYTLHVELCHLKSISSFPKDTKISIVNSLDNLAYLCPTHHWEQENNLLNIESGKSTEN